MLKTPLAPGAFSYLTPVKRPHTLERPGQSAAWQSPFKSTIHTHIITDGCSSLDRVHTARLRKDRAKELAPVTKILFPKSYESSKEDENLKPQQKALADFFATENLVTTAAEVLLGYFKDCEKLEIEDLPFIDDLKGAFETIANCSVSEKNQVLPNATQKELDVIYENLIISFQPNADEESKAVQERLLAQAFISIHFDRIYSLFEKMHVNEEFKPYLNQCDLLNYLTHQRSLFSNIEIISENLEDLGYEMLLLQTELNYLLAQKNITEFSFTKAASEEYSASPSDDDTDTILSCVKSFLNAGTETSNLFKNDDAKETLRLLGEQIKQIASWDALSKSEDDLWDLLSDIKLKSKNLYKQADKAGDRKFALAISELMLEVKTILKEIGYFESADKVIPRENIKWRKNQIPKKIKESHRKSFLRQVVEQDKNRLANVKEFKELSNDPTVYSLSGKGGSKNPWFMKTFGYTEQDKNDWEWETRVYQTLYGKVAISVPQGSTGSPASLILPTLWRIKNLIEDREAVLFGIADFMQTAHSQGLSLGCLDFDSIRKLHVQGTPNYCLDPKAMLLKAKLSQKGEEAAHEKRVRKDLNDFQKLAKDLFHKEEPFLEDLNIRLNKLNVQCEAEDYSRNDDFCIQEPVFPAFQLKVWLEDYFGDVVDDNTIQIISSDEASEVESEEKFSHTLFKGDKQNTFVSLNVDNDYLEQLLSQYELNNDVIEICNRLDFIKYLTSIKFTIDPIKQINKYLLDAAEKLKVSLEKFTINSENLKNIHNACGHWLNAAHKYQDATHQKEIDQVKQLHRLTYVFLMQLKYSTPADSEDQTVSETITPVDIFSQLKIYIESKINGDQIKSDSLKELLYLLDDENMDLSPAIKLIKIQEIAERYQASTVHNIYRMFSHIGNRAAIEEASWLRELFSRIKNTNLLRDGSENDNETYQKATLAHLDAYLKPETEDDVNEVGLDFADVYQNSKLRMI